MGPSSQSLPVVSESHSSIHMSKCIFTVVIVLLIRTISAIYVTIDKVEYEEYDYLDQPDDYGNEEMLWGNELNPQWCDPPLLNDTYGDRFSVRNSFINPNSKGQYATETLIEMRCGDGRRLKLNDSLVHPLRAAYLRCTLSTLALRGEWALIGMLDYLASFTPTCTSEAATLVICDLPHLNPDEFLIDRNKKARFYKHNETLTLRCAKSNARLLPNGSHTLRCDDTGWVHEVNKRPVADVSPVCVMHSRCTLQQIPKYLQYAINGSICNESSQFCPSNNETLSIGFKVTLSCKSQSLRLNGHSEVICAESQIVDGSMWYPIKWPLCSSKLNCLTPYIHLGDYLAEDSSNIFRPGSRVSFECFEEHKLIGSRVVECTDIGYWNDTLPTCIEDIKEINESLVYSALIVTKVILLIILVYMIKLIRDQNRRFRRDAYDRSLKAISPSINRIPPSDVRILNLNV